MENVLAEYYLSYSNKLDGENYANWKFKLQTLMEGNNTWAIVSRVEVKPVSPQATDVAIQDWERRENKAKVLLWMTVKENIIPHIRECKTSKETWDSLKILYEMKITN